MRDICSKLGSLYSNLIDMVLGFWAFLDNQSKTRVFILKDRAHAWYLNNWHLEVKNKNKIKAFKKKSAR